jgi:hypothetical protein
MAVRLGVGEYELRERLFWAGDRLIPFAIKNLISVLFEKGAGHRCEAAPARRSGAAIPSSY